MRNVRKISIFLVLLFLIAWGQPADGQRLASENVAAVRVPDGSDFPALRVNGIHFDPSGWICSRILSNGFGGIRKEMDACKLQGYGCFVLRLDWPAIEPVAGGMRWDTLQKVLTHADAIGMKLLIALEMDIAPEWFVEAHPEAVAVTKYIDEHVDLAETVRPRKYMEGRLEFRNGTGIIGFHWPNTAYRWEETDFYKEMRLSWEERIDGLADQVYEHECFIGWALNSPASPLGYPGGGIQGIMGMGDYSDARRELFFKTTNDLEAPDPLPRYSQGFPDGRPEWLEFSLFRVKNRRNFIDFVGKQLKSSDPYHPVFFFPGEILSYLSDNGYLAECEALDWGYYLRQTYIDGVILPFQLSALTFATGYHPGEGDLVPLQAAISAAVNNRKLPLVWVEKSKEPPSKNDISAFANLLKVLGAYPLYSQPLRYADSEAWGKKLTMEIETASFLRLLPPPVKRQPPGVVVLDYPFFFGKFYAEKDDVLKTASIQLEVFNQAGIPFDVIDVQTVIDYPSVLDSYGVVVPLARELLDTDFYLESGIEDVIEEFKDRGGAMYYTQPIKLKEFAEGGFSDVNFIEESRIEFVRFGSGTNQVSSPDVTVVIAQPYIFFYPHKHRYDAYLNAFIGGWTTEGSQELNFVEIMNERRETADVFTSLARFDLDVYGGRPYLYAETKSILGVIDLVRARRNAITTHQTEVSMRRFVPISLVVCFIMLLLLAFYSLHGFKDKIQQEAIRIKGSAQLEEFDAHEVEQIKKRSYIRDLDNPHVLKRIVGAAGLGDMGSDAAEALPALRSHIAQEEDEYVKQAILDAIAKIEGYK